MTVLEGISKVCIRVSEMIAIAELSLPTESSGVKCSDGETLRLCAAQRMSFDFFNVSSILQAVNSAAAAASTY